MQNDVNKIAYIALIILLTGCAVYNSVDARLFPAPEMPKEPEAYLQKKADGYSLITFIQVKHAEIVFWDYDCWKQDQWWSAQGEDIPDTKVTDGETAHLRPLKCFSKVRLTLRAYNNFGKRTQKMTKGQWKIDIEPALARIGAKGIHTVASIDVEGVRNE